jgi:hypothetical protein
MSLSWAAVIQLATVIRNDSSNDIMFWIFVGGVVPSMAIGIFLNYLQERRYNYSEWVMENSEDDGGYIVVGFLIQYLHIYLYILKYYCCFIDKRI